MTSRSKSIAKYILALVLLALILYKTDIRKIGGYLSAIPPLHLVMALALVTLAQIAAAMRMRYFFHQSGYTMHRQYAVVLFYVGAFYNFLLPGGIGGDAYKVMLARKRLHMPTMHGIKIMVADRASGLCIVMMILFLSLYFMNLSSIIPHINELLSACALVTLAAYLLLSHLLLGQKPRAMLISLHYSLYTQILWVLTLYTLWVSLGNGENFTQYAALYCAASIAALIPVSVGGLGIKESTYFYGAALIQKYTGVGVDGELGITLSLCVFALSFVACLPGTFWLHNVGKKDTGHA